MQHQNLKRIFLQPFQKANVTSDIKSSKEEQDNKRYDDTPRDKIFEERKKDKEKKKMNKNKDVNILVP